MNKNKILIVIVLTCTVIITIGSMFLVKKIVYNKKIGNINQQYESTNNTIAENKIQNRVNENNIVEESKDDDIITEPFDREEYDRNIKHLAENEMNGIEEKTVIIIRDESNKEYNITDKDIELFQYLGADENDTEEEIKKDMVEYKICYIESQKLGLKLSKEELEQIEKLSLLESDLKYFKNNDKAKNRFKERQRNYFLQIHYRAELMRKISKEISNNKISINDEKVNDKMKEYNKNLEEYKKIEDPTGEETNVATKKSISLGMEIMNLYMDAIESKYTVEYK